MRESTSNVYLKMLHGVWSARSDEPVYDKYSVNVVASEPDEGDECPITGGLISDCDTIFDTKLSFFPDEKLVTKGSLPCEHSFSLLHLAYHFIQNDMRCPICRSGSHEKLAMGCLPLHVCTAFERQRALTVATDDRRDQNRMQETHIIFPTNVMGRLFNMIMPFSGNADRINTIVKLRVSIRRMDSDSDFTNFIMIPMRRAARVANSHCTYFTVQSSMTILRQFLARHRAVEMSCSVVVGINNGTSRASPEFAPIAQSPKITLPFFEHHNHHFTNNGIFENIQIGQYRVRTINPYNNSVQRGGITLYCEQFNQNTNMDFPFKRIQWEPDDEEADGIFQSLFEIQASVSLM